MDNQSIVNERVVQPTPGGAIPNPQAQRPTGNYMGSYQAPSLQSRKNAQAKQMMDQRDFRRGQLIREIQGKPPQPTPITRDSVEWLLREQSFFQNQLSKQFGNGLDPLAYRRAIPPRTHQTHGILYGN